MKVFLFVAVFALIFTFCKPTTEVNNDATNVDQKIEDSVEFDENQPDINEEDFIEEKEDNEEETATDENTIQLKKNQVVNSQGLAISVGHKGQIVITLNNKYNNYWTTYTVWGKNRCRRGATTLYNGYVGGSDHTHKGDSSEYICLPKNPQYLSTVAPRYQAFLHGTEYESFNRVLAGTTHDFNVPCAVCKVRKQNTLVIPARVSCPSGWYREYYGYLMTSFYNHNRSGTYKCVHGAPDVIPGSQANTNGALFYFVQLRSCAFGLPCGTNQYVLNRATTCVVCSKK